MAQNAYLSFDKHIWDTKLACNRKLSAKKAVEIFLVLVTLLLVGCVAASPQPEPRTNPAADVQWTIMLHYSQKYVCTNLSDESYFNMIWERIEEDMVAITKRKKEPEENILLYKHELKEEVLENRRIYRERYGCPP